MSILSFDNRSLQDQFLACKRIAQPFLSALPAHEAPESAFKQDEKMIKGSAAFRRGKGLSMVAPSVSHVFQNRASHALMVADNAADIAQRMQLGAASVALTRSIALMHDLGHPPFSHEGEAALNHKLNPLGLTWGHDQAGLETILNDHEHSLAEEGLPLTIATLEGAAKRHHRFNDTDAEYTILAALEAKLGKKGALHLQEFSPVEGQIASVADWISGTVTDVQDMMSYYLASDNPAKNTKEFFDDLCAHFPLGKKLADEISREFKMRLVTSSPEARKNYRDRSQHQPDRRIRMLVNTFCERLQETLIEDVVQNSQTLIQHYAPKISHAEDVRILPELVATASPGIIAQLDELKEFYKQKVYPFILARHVNTIAIVEQAFDDFALGHVKMLDGWDNVYQNITQSSMNNATKARETAKLVARYISTTMTDEDVLWHYQRYHAHAYAQLMKAAQNTPRPVTSPPAPEHIR